MKLTSERLCAWFYTASAKIMQAELHSFPPEAERQWMETLATKKGRERSSMVSGLKQGVNDLLTMSKMISPESRKEVDASLASRGLPSLRLMQAGLKKKHERVLARGEIKNDEEFYLVSEILSDTEFEVSAADRRSLGKMSAAYEAKTK